MDHGRAVLCFRVYRSALTYRAPDVGNVSSGSASASGCSGKGTPARSVPGRMTGASHPRRRSAQLWASSYQSRTPLEAVKAVPSGCTMAYSHFFRSVLNGDLDVGDAISMTLTDAGNSGSAPDGSSDTLSSTSCSGSSSSCYPASDPEAVGAVVAPAQRECLGCRCSGFASEVGVSVREAGGVVGALGHTDCRCCELRTRRWDRFGPAVRPCVGYASGTLFRVRQSPPDGSTQVV